MKLNRLRVAGWRCFPEGLELKDLGDGLNVVHGPNGVGKTSLFKALVRVFCDRHSVKAEAIRNLQPWGTDLPPEATIEFEHDGGRWRIEKKFLHGAYSKLSKFDGVKFIPVANDTQADERLHEILQVESPKSGAVKKDHWGLAQMLWAEQGELQLPSLAAPSRQVLQQSLGAQVSGAEATAVEKKAADEFARFYTGQGKLKSGAGAPPIVGLRDQLTQAQARVQELRRKLHAYDEAVHRIEELRLLAEQAAREEKEVAAQEEKVVAAARAYEQAAAQRDLAAREVDAARAKADQIRSRMEGVIAARQELATWKDKLAAQERDAESLKTDSLTRQRFADEMQRKLESIRARRGEIDAAERRARQAERFVNFKAKVAKHKEILDQVAALAIEREKVQTARSKFFAPDAKQLQALRKAWKDRDDARLRLEASLITVEFTAAAATKLEVQTGDEPGPAAVAKGEAFVAKGSPEVVLELEGVGVIRARGPAGSVEQLRRDVQTTETALEQLLSGYQEKELPALEAAHLQAVEADAKLKELRIKIDSKLDNRAREEWERDYRLAENQLEEILTEEPSWRTQPPDAMSLNAAKERQLQEFKTQVDLAENQKDLAVKAASDAAAKLHSLEEARRLALAQHTATEHRLTQLISDGLSDEARHDAFVKASMENGVAVGALREADQRLAEFAGDPRGELKLLNMQVAALREGAAEKAKQLNFAEGELQKIVQESPYSALAAEEENVAKLQEDIARDELQLSAVKLLHETLVAKRKSVVDSLVGPIRLRAGRTLQRIMGPRFAELDIGDDFSASGIVPRDQTESVGLTELSGGEREQVYFAVRLALADIAFPDGKQLVVLDDVFTFTDRGRLGKIVQLLGEAAERFQIVMLTCHPERYAGLDGAKMFDLEAIRAGQPGKLLFA